MQISFSDNTAKDLLSYGSDIQQNEPEMEPGKLITLYLNIKNQSTFSIYIIILKIEISFQFTKMTFHLSSSIIHKSLNQIQQIIKLKEWKWKQMNL